MNTSFLSRHRIVRIAVIATGTLALCSGGAYALASTSGGTTVSSAPASPQTHHQRDTVLACPMIPAHQHHRNRFCHRIRGPVFHCPRNAMCARPCAVPVNTPVTATGGQVLNGTTRVRCVLPPVINPGGPMIPAGTAGGSGAGWAPGSPPTVTTVAP
jgi:hypothetical protein